MGKLKKKAVKAEQKTVKLPKLAAIPLKPSRPPKPDYQLIRAAPRAVAREKSMKMAKEYEDSGNVNENPVTENTSLRDRLRNQMRSSARTAAKKFVRGMLPGNRYIKTDPETGHYEEVDKQEWDSLA